MSVQRNDGAGGAGLAGEAASGAVERGSIGTTLGWAAYLAASWTWCIGAFLPVLLVRDFGIGGFVLFAAPNVVGAAAMGWVLSRRAAAGILRRHAGATVASSLVTLSYHLFALLYLLEPLALRATGSPAAAPVVALAPLMLVLVVLVRAPSGRWFDRLLAGVVMLLSAGLGVALVGMGTSGPHAAAGRGAGHPGAGVDLLMLGPVVVFGFVLCPYLDPTFLRARAAQGRGTGRASFTLGFGVLFLAMILLTLLYAGMLGPLASVTPAAAEPGTKFAGLGAAAAGLILAHMIVQFALTGFVHLRESAARVDLRDARVAGVCVVVLLAGLAAGLASGHERIWQAMRAGEVVYRAFLGFYGLVLPAYVYLCVIPTADGHSGASRKKLRVWALAVGVAAPFFWMGFVRFEELFLAPGLGIVLLARLALPGGPGVRLEGARAGGGGQDASERA